MEAMIRVAADPDDAFVGYALELFSSFLSIEITLATDRHCDIYYGNDPGRSCSIRIPHVAGFAEQDIPRDAGSAYDAEMAAPFPFDLFSAVRFWLADEGNAAAPADRFDRHDRLGIEDSAQHRLGVRDTPIVNTYMLLFGSWLESRLGIQVSGGLPSGIKAMIALSHDVDEPIDPGDVAHNRRFQRELLGRSVSMALHGKFRSSVSTARTLYNWSAKRRGAKDERHWLFEEVLDSERNHGFQSTFFFAVKTLYDADGSIYDVAYDFRDSRFDAVYREIADHGSEVGLHISYNARESAERIGQERSALERASALAVHGSRHHFWHMSRPAWRTLTDHGRAGLHYDTSIAFNEAPGYRLGVGFPFFPWDPQNGRKIPTLQIPTFVMDKTLFQSPDADVPSARARFIALLEELKRNRGVAAIDWHVRASHPGSRAFERMGRAYLEILDVLMADTEVAVGSCAEIAAQFGVAG
jgi:hypothetical protein